MPCRFCGGEIPPERAEIYQHCTNQTCVQMWMAERRSDMRIMLVPKQGFTVVNVNTSHIPSGKSSGR